MIFSRSLSMTDPIIKFEYFDIRQKLLDKLSKLNLSLSVSFKFLTKSCYLDLSESSIDELYFLHVRYERSMHFENEEILLRERFIFPMIFFMYVKKIDFSMINFSFLFHLLLIRTQKSIQIM